jgi:UDP-glucose 4-epimerase
MYLFSAIFKDTNLSPYAYYKSFILNLILNYKDWYGLKYEILYFFNVYGGSEILKNEMKAVIGIFENQKKHKKNFTVVKPGTQSRIFTYIEDLVTECIKVMKMNKNGQYIIKAKKSYTILEIAKSFNHK